MIVGVLADDPGAVRRDDGRRPRDAHALVGEGPCRAVFDVDQPAPGALGRASSRRPRARSPSGSHLTASIRMRRTFGTSRDSPAPVGWSRMRGGASRGERHHPASVGRECVRVAASQRARVASRRRAAGRSCTGYADWSLSRTARPSGVMKRATELSRRVKSCGVGRPASEDLHGPPGGLPPQEQSPLPRHVEQEEVGRRGEQEALPALQVDGAEGQVAVVGRGREPDLLSRGCPGQASDAARPDVGQHLLVTGEVDDGDRPHVVGPQRVIGEGDRGRPAARRACG